MYYKAPTWGIFIKTGKLKLEKVYISRVELYNFAINADS